MIKREYLVDYTIRPNKKAPGRSFHRQMAMKKFDDAKVIYTLAALHRVNQNAVELESRTLVKTRLVFFDWLGAQFRRLMRRAA